MSPSYAELLEHLHQVSIHGGVKLGLQNMSLLKQALGHPDHAFDTVHVAGTNGKGSVTTMIAQALQLSGKRVGLYTSPHLSSFRERICVDGEKITETSVQELLPIIFQCAHELGISATFFELTTALALLYFAAQEVDVVVLETGLGGRFDATNVVMPKLSVITSISYDHMAILGNTLEQIAYEKAGIIKEGVPVILGPKAAGLGIEAVAKQKKSRCHIVQGDFDDYIHENRAVAREALLELQTDMQLSPEHIEQGLQSLPPCRFEEVIPRKLSRYSLPDNAPTVILDVAHNPDGLHALFAAVKKRYPQHSLRVIAGFSDGKDIVSCLQPLRQHAEHVHLVDAAHHRIMPLSRLLPIAEKERVNVQQPSGDLKTVLPMILQLASAGNEIVLICGSCFIMHDARIALGYSVEGDSCHLHEHFSPSFHAQS
jgi:dihydrofolate synthase / folylpolyglutamate synthase